MVSAKEHKAHGWKREGQDQNHAHRNNEYALEKLFALLLFFGKTLALEGTLLALLQPLCVIFCFLPLAIESLSVCVWSP